MTTAAASQIRTKTKLCIGTSVNSRNAPNSPHPDARDRQEDPPRLHDSDLDPVQPLRVEDAGPVGGDQSQRVAVVEVQPLAVEVGGQQRRGELGTLEEGVVEASFGSSDSSRIREPAEPPARSTTSSSDSPRQLAPTLQPSTQFTGSRASCVARGSRSSRPSAYGVGPATSSDQVGDVASVLHFGLLRGPVDRHALRAFRPLPDGEQTERLQRGDRLADRRHHDDADPRPGGGQQAPPGDARGGPDRRACRRCCASRGSRPTGSRSARRLRRPWPGGRTRCRAA